MYSLVFNSNRNLHSQRTFKSTYTHWWRKEKWKLLARNINYCTMSICYIFASFFKSCKTWSNILMVISLFNSQHRPCFMSISKAIDGTVYLKTGWCARKFTIYNKDYTHVIQNGIINLNPFKEEKITKAYTAYIIIK